MKTWIALFRGINVGGRNTLPMAKLRMDLESLNLGNVRTYIQSGNVIFTSGSQAPSSIGSAIIQRVEQQHGFRPHVVLLTRDDLTAAIKIESVSRGCFRSGSLHFFFLSSAAAAPDTEAIEKAKASTESYRLTDRIFYLHAPDGVSRSKLAARAEKHLGVVATARNYRTVRKLNEMVKEC